MQRFFPFLAGAFFLTSGPALAQSRATFDRTLNVSGAVQLQVSSGSGTITVRTGEDGTLAIHGEVRAKSRWSDEVRTLAADPPIIQDGNVITIGPNDSGEMRRHVSVSYELVVPVATRLETNTGSGSQSIGDIAGPLDITSGSGSLDIGRIGTRVEASTGSGSISIQGVDGDLEVATGSGSIRAEGVSGSMSAKSGSGSIRLEQIGSGDVDVHTGSGRIRVAGLRGGLQVHTASGSVDVQGEIEEDWDLRASSGSITVTLPAESAFDLDARTSSGDIDSSHPISVTGNIAEHRLRGSVRGGGPRLAVRTSSGSIQIK